MFSWLVEEEQSKGLRKFVFFWRGDPSCNSTAPSLLWKERWEKKKKIPGTVAGCGGELRIWPGSTIPAWNFLGMWGWWRGWRPWWATGRSPGPWAAEGLGSRFFGRSTVEWSQIWAESLLWDEPWLCWSHLGHPWSLSGMFPVLGILISPGALLSLLYCLFPAWTFFFPLQIALIMHPPPVPLCCRSDRMCYCTVKLSSSPSSSSSNSNCVFHSWFLPHHGTAEESSLSLQKGS